MLDEVTAIRRRFDGRDSLEECIDEAFGAATRLGYDALIYDYTPVPYDLDGTMMIPSMLKLRNIADDMHDYWCDRGYFRIDPVQIVAARSSTPFAWSYDKGMDTEIGALLNETTEPVARYLRERDLASGVTIPIHMPRGGYATVTGIRPGSSEGDDHDAAIIAADDEERCGIGEVRSLANRQRSGRRRQSRKDAGAFDATGTSNCTTGVGRIIEQGDRASAQRFRRHGQSPPVQYFPEA